MREWFHELNHKQIWWYTFCVVLLFCVLFVFAVQHKQANKSEVQATSDSPRVAVTQPHDMPNYTRPDTPQDFEPVLSRLKKRTDSGKPIMYLSFDDGPSTYTPALLDVLRKHDVKATFFMLGLNVRQHPDHVRAVVAAGHEVGNHTYSHSSMPDMTTKKIEQEIMRTADLILAAAPNVNGDGRLDLLRPPYGANSMRVQKAAKKMGYRIAIWNIDPEDWKSIGYKKISQNVRANAKPGAVVLAHDGGRNQSTTIKAFDKIIPQLKARGYVFWTMSQGL